MTQLRIRAAFASFVALSLFAPLCAGAQDVPAAGPVVRLSATLDGKLHADGRTPVLLKIEAIDRFSQRARAGTGVRVEIVGGDARFERIARLRTDYGNLSALPNTFDTAHLPVYPLPNGNGELAPSPAPNGAPDGGTPVVTQVTPDRPTLVQQQTARATTDSVGSYARAGDDAAAGRTNLSTPGDNEAAAQSVDLKVPADGDLTVPIFPGTTAGPIRVRVSSGDVSSEYSFFIEPNYRQPIVTGLLTAGAGAVPAPPGRPDDAADGFYTRRGRVALYATGETLPSTLVTVAYDTANRLTRSPATGPYIDDPNGRPFSTYGDSSTRYLDALSRDHLYARVDTPHAAGMWGEFIADTGNHDATAPDGFNLLVDGIKGEGRFSGDRGQVSAFNANNDVAYARQIINPNDLATFNTTLHPGIVLGSDTITLVTFDRRTGATIAQRVLARSVDYTLDYYTGRLYFINVPLRFDDNFNPQSLLVQYEYQGVGSSSVTGGRVDYALGRSNSTRVGFGYANYATASNNATTTTEDLTGNLKGGTWSFAHETGTGPSVFGDTFLPASILQGNGTTSGDLWRAGINVAGGPSRYQLAYTTTSSGYVNPFGGIATPGFTNYLASYDYTFRNDQGGATLRFDGQHNDIAGTSGSQNTIAADLRHRLGKRLQLNAGISHQTASATSSFAPALGSTLGSSLLGGGLLQLPNSNSTQGNVGVDYRVAPTVGLSLARLFNISGTNYSEPGQTAAQLNVDFPNKGRAYVRQLWSDNPTIPFATSSSPYTQVAQSKASTAVGFERAVGANTTVDTEYVLENTGSGSDVYSALGVKERFTFTRFFAGDLSFRHANALGGSGFGIGSAGLGSAGNGSSGIGSTGVGNAIAGTGIDAAGLGFDDYGINLTTTDKARVRGALSLQDRTGNGSGFTGRFGVAGAVSRDLSLLSDYNLSSISGLNFAQGRVGLAFRPALSDRSATLLEYDNQSGTLVQAGIGIEPSAYSNVATSAAIISLAETWQIGSRSEVDARYANKLDGSGYLPAHSDLFGARLDQRIGPRFDLGGEVALLRSSLATEIGNTTFAIEGGYRLGGATRIAGGYNFTGSPDPTLSNSSTHRGAYVTLTSVVDRVFGWGRPGIESQLLPDRR